MKKVRGKRKKERRQRKERAPHHAGFLETRSRPQPVVPPGSSWLSAPPWWPRSCTFLLLDRHKGDISVLRFSVSTIGNSTGHVIPKNIISLLRQPEPPPASHRGHKVASPHHLTWGPGVDATFLSPLQSSIILWVRRMLS